MGYITGEYLAKVKVDVNGEIPDKADEVADVMSKMKCDIFTGIENSISTEFDDVFSVDVYGLKLSDDYGSTATIINENTDNSIVGMINNLIIDYKGAGGSAKGISDQYHTFDELYYHRMILFLALQKCFPSISWKSKKHDDNTMFDDSFIVGIDTPKGQYTYHYNLKFWDMFKDIKELEFAPKFDGHTPADIDDRLLSLF